MSQYQAAPRELAGMPGSPKRKRQVFDDERGIPQSSPPEPISPYPIKRTKIQEPEHKQMEIPSTPDGSSVANTLSARDDMESDDEDNRSQRQVSLSLSEPGRPHHVHKDEESIPDEYLSAVSEWEDTQLDHRTPKGPVVEETQPTQPTQTVVGETQAIFRGETPTLDFSIAEPDGGWDDFAVPLSPAPMPPSSQLTTQDEEDAEEEAVLPTAEEVKAKLEAWIDRHIELGFDLDHIEMALKSTGMDLDLADEILPYMQRAGHVPKDVEGVWTDEDDACLEDVDARKIQAMIRKHGQEGFDRRFTFLRNYHESA